VDRRRPPSTPDSELEQNHHHRPTASPAAHDRRLSARRDSGL